jgi:SRSO17 transposase
MSKPQLAARMLEDMVRTKPFPFRWVAADSIYGSSPDFIKTVEKYSDLRYFVSVPSDISCWLTSPITRKKKYKYKSQLREKTILESTQKRPITVESLAKSINNFFWYRRKVSEGTKGPIEYEFTKKRVVLSKDELPDRTVWLIIRRTIGRGDRTYRYFISNAPVSTRLPTFVWLSGLRWPIEQCFEETKTELGMDQYEVRKYPGWNHHVLTCMLAHFFLWHLKIRLGKKSTVGYSIAA